MEIEKRVRKEGGHMSYYIDMCPCSVVYAPRPPAASSAYPAPCSVVCVPRPLQRHVRAPPRLPAASSACPAPLQRRLRAPPVPAASQAPARWFPERRPVYRAAGKHRCRKARRPHPQAR